jgi:hypothetical protein
VGTERFSLPLGRLNSSQCGSALICDSQTSVNLGASRCRPMMLLGVAECFKEAVRIVRLDLLCQQRPEYFFTPGVVESPQRVEEYRPKVETFLCNCLLAKRRTIYKLDILDTHFSFGSSAGRSGLIRPTDADERSRGLLRASTNESSGATSPQKKWSIWMR